MRCLFLSVGHYITPASSSTRTVVAMHLDAAAAAAFEAECNALDAEGWPGDCIETEVVPLVDRYGFPCTPAEYAACFPAGLT